MMKLFKLFVVVVEHRAIWSTTTKEMSETELTYKAKILPFPLLPTAVVFTVSPNTAVTNPRYRVTTC